MRAGLFASLALAGALSTWARGCLLPSFDDVRATGAPTPGADAATDAGGDAANVPDASLVGCDDPTALAIWPMTEGTGTTINDCTGKYPGTFNGKVGWTAGRNGLPALDMQGGYISLVDVPDLAIIGPFTIAIWFKASGTQVDGFGDILARYDSLNVSVFDITVVPGTQPTVGVNFFQPGNLGNGLNAFIAPGIYTHVTITYDPTTNAIAQYMNGTLDTSGAIPTTLQQRAVPLTIGANHGGTSVFTGAIAGLRIYTSVLSPAKIKSLVK